MFNEIDYRERERERLLLIERELPMIRRDLGLLGNMSTWALICQPKDNGRLRKREGQGLVRERGHLGIVEACES